MGEAEGGARTNAHGVPAGYRRGAPAVTPSYGVPAVPYRVAALGGSKTVSANSLPKQLEHKAVCRGSPGSNMSARSKKGAETLK